MNPTLDYKANAFHCPHCGVYTKQEWRNVAKGIVSTKGLGFYEGFIPELYLSICTQCGEYTIWLNDKIVYPAVSSAPWPAEEMPQTVKECYLEARNVVFASPKTACALLRLCLQGLMVFLGESGKNMSRDISSLVEKGLQPKFRDKLREFRVIGFNAVTPGEISTLDDDETAVALFNLVNLIVEATIPQQRKVRQVYVMVPTPQPVAIKQTRKRTRKSKRNDGVLKPTLLYR